MKRTIAAYKHNQIFMSTPGDLLIALYDGMARFCTEAKEAIERKNPAAKGVAIGRAFDIITELSASLDDSKDPKFCREMSRLYDYWFNRLQQGSLTMNAEPVDEVIRQVLEMRGTWHQAVAIARREGVRA